MTKNRPSSNPLDNDLVMPLPEGAFKENVYFPTFVFSLEVPGAKALNVHLTETIWLERDYGFERYDAYMMLGQCAKVRLGNFVDPKYTMGAAIPKCYLA